MPDIPNSYQEQSKITPQTPAGQSFLAKLKTKWPKGVLLSVGGLFFLTIIIYTVYSYGKQGQEIQLTPTPTIAPSPSPITEAIPILPPEISPTLAPTQPATRVTPPATFGYAKTLDLYGIGVRASFPEGVTVSYTNPASSYTATMEEYDTVSFSIQDYSGGGRRDWFLANHGYPDNTFESFTANKHTGYLSYYKDSEGKASGAFFYFTVVKPDKALLISSYNNTSSVYFFASNLERFKSFLSTVKITESDLTKVDPSQKKESQEWGRWSDTRQTLWDNNELGLRLTAPEWMERRYSKDGEWTKMTPKASFSENTNTLSITGTFASYPHLKILDEKYIGKSFEYVITDSLVGAGFCSTEWKGSTDNCAGQDFCYTKADVARNYFLKETTAIGSYPIQLWWLRADFSWRNDCRAEGSWLIKAKDGRFVYSTFNPDSETLRIESL